MIAAAVILCALATTLAAVAGVGVMVTVKSVNEKTPDQVFMAGVTVAVLLLISAGLCALASLAWSA